MVLVLVRAKKSDESFSSLFLTHLPSPITLFIASLAGDALCAQLVLPGEFSLRVCVCVCVCVLCADACCARMRASERFALSE